MTSTLPLGSHAAASARSNMASMQANCAGAKNWRLKMMCRRSRDVEIDTFWKAGYNAPSCSAHTEKHPSIVLIIVLTMPEHSFRNFFQHLLRYNVGSYQSKSCARSSVDRALVFGTRCRGFESLRAYCFCLSLLLLLSP
jgi:hypothetical protein